MKKITNPTSTRSRMLPALGLLLTIATLLPFAPASARAGDEVPFHANFITQFESVVDFPFLHVTVHGQGNATYMGSTTAFTDDQLVNLIDGSGSATYTLTAAYGDTVVLALLVPAGGTVNVDGGVTFSGSYTITGGTGRFSGATGLGAFAGSAFFFSGTGAFSADGTIVFNNPPPVDVTSTLQLTRGGFRFVRATQRFVQTLTIRNTTATPLAGPVSIVLDSLSPAVTLHAPTGTTAFAPPLGSPFITLDVGGDGMLGVGETITLNLEFSDPSNQSITYNLRALAGYGLP